MATFERRESGYWQVKVRRKGYPAESRTFRTKAEAEEWARDIESKIDRGVFVSASEAERTLFSDLVKSFKEDFAPHHYRVRADEKEAWRFQCDRLQDFFGPYSLAAIDQKLIASFRDERQKGTAKRKAVAGSTVRKEMFMLSKILGFAEMERGIPLPRGNPVQKVRKPKESEGRERRLTSSEWSRLEQECRNSRNHLLWPAVELAVETATRQGELLQLRREDINTKDSVALVKKTKNGDPRAIPLSPRAKEIIKGLPASITGLVMPLERMTLYHAFIAACGRAGITDFTFHDLRHEALSRIAERGDFIELEIRSVSGHKTLQMLDYYMHLNAAKLAKKLATPPK